MTALTIVGNVHNIATDRHHPIVFRYAPTPSGCDRYKSIGHHTDGFDTRDAAIEFINHTLTKHFPGCQVNVDKDYAWDGSGTPAMVIFPDDTGAPIF